MSDINTFVARMRYWCENADLGYGQDTRWNIYEGGDADCSSLVIHCLREAGFDTGDASFTGDILPALAVRGWTLAQPPLQPGDILLAPGSHVAAYVGDGQIAEAAINEHGDIADGIPGDQTGQETRITDYYDYPWDYILRWNGSPNDEPETEDSEMFVVTNSDNEESYLLTCTSFRQVSYPQAQALLAIGIPRKRVNSGHIYSLMECMHESTYDADKTVRAYRAAHG